MAHLHRLVNLALPASERVTAVFAHMSIAEEVIAAAGDLPGLYNALEPPEDMRHLDPQVYRAHAQEMARRAHAGEPLDVPTDAELLIGMMKASLLGPLTPQGYAVYHALAMRVIPEAAVFDDTPEPWPGAIEEEIAAARAKIRGKRPRTLKEYIR